MGHLGDDSGAMAVYHIGHPLEIGDYAILEKVDFTPRTTGRCVMYTGRPEGDDQPATALGLFSNISGVPVSRHAVLDQRGGMRRAHHPVAQLKIPQFIRAE